MFKNTFETDWQIAQDVVLHEKTLTLFLKIDSLPVFAEIDVTDPLKYVDTIWKQSVHGTVSVGHQKHLQKPHGGHGNGDMVEETEPRYPTEVQQSLQCYPDSDRLVEESGSVLSDLWSSFVSFTSQ